MTTRVPAEAFPPGDFLREELEARGWSQIEFAEIINRPLRTVNEIIAGKRGVSPATAKEFAAALGTSPELWMNLETAYRLKNTDPAPERIRRLARLRSRYPVRDMVRRGWIEPSGSPDVLEAQVLKFFSIRSLDEHPRLAHAAKRSEVTQDMNPLQTAWLFRVKQLAAATTAAKYSESKLRDAVNVLQELLVAPEEARHVPRILSDAGVRFVVVEPFAGSKIDGVCFWLSASEPVIGLTMRFDRIDNFWFVLPHEIKHVLDGHGKTEAIIDTDLDRVASGEIAEEELSDQENAANRAAAEFCVPQDQLANFIARVHPTYSRAHVLGFARLMNIHPGIVVGQLHRKTGRYSLFRPMLAKIREYVTSTAVTDGYGKKAAVLV